jgi:hypothetical protein
VPTSSASISVTERLSPSGVSQVRWRSRPGDHDPVTLGQGLPAGLEVFLASRKLGGLIVTEVNPTTIPAASSPVWSTIRSRRSPDSRQLGPELRTIRSWKA